MNVDRKTKKPGNRIIEYFTLKYETDVESGLTSQEVRHRQRKSNIGNISKEKKRIWLICFKQECRDPLFLFFIYLCGISRIFHISGAIHVTLFFTFFFLLILKICRAFRSTKILFQQKEVKSEKAIVLRDGVFHRIPWKYLVRGDIVRLKRGEKVAGNILSLNEPYKEYVTGELFMENTGRAIVTQQIISDLWSSDLKSSDLTSEKSEQDSILQEITVQQEIFFKNLWKRNGKGLEIEKIEKNIWIQFSENLKKAEKQIVESLCVFMILAFVLWFCFPQKVKIQCVLQVGILFCILYIVGREVVWELSRRWFIQKVKRRKLNYMRQVNKINNT